MNKNTKKLAVFGMVLMTCFILFAFGMFSVKANESVLKVGYDLNSNFILESNGEYYGYGVEYLEKIAQYTEWTYSYVQDASGRSHWKN